MPDNFWLGRCLPGPSIVLHSVIAGAHGTVRSRTMESSLRTDHFLLDPDSLGPYVDPNAPTIPDLPAYQPGWSGPPMPSRPVSLFERAMNRFSRLSVGARIVCVGCVTLVAFCLVSPYIDIAESTISQAINYGTSAAPAGSAANPSGSTHTSKRHPSTTNVTARRDGALAWTTSAAAPIPIPLANPDAGSHAKLHAHSHRGAADAHHHRHGHGLHGG